MRILKGGHIALGVTVGACLTVMIFFALEYFSTVLTPDTTLWAAMIGALLGGGISLAGQVLQAEEMNRQKEADQRKIDLVHAYTLFEVLNDILSTISAVEKHCKSQLKEAEEIGYPYKFLGILPLSGARRLPLIPTEIKVMLMSSKALDLYNSINNIDQFSSNLLDLFSDLQTRRREILELRDPVGMNEPGFFLIRSGKQREFDERYQVLEWNFGELLLSLTEAKNSLESCIEGTTKLINNSGDKAFRFELKVANS